MQLAPSDAGVVIADQSSSIVANLAKCVAGFSSFVDQLYRLHEQQYLFACLALGNAGALDGEDLRALASMIIEQKRHVVLGKLLVHPVEKNVCQVLYKLGLSPHPNLVCPRTHRQSIVI